MTDPEINKLAKARGQYAVDALIPGGSHRYLLLASRYASVDQLAQLLNTDAWELWLTGEWVVYDKHSRPLLDTTKVRDWAKLQPVSFQQRVE